MDFKSHLSFSLSDRSYQNIIKKDIVRVAEGIGFNLTETGKISIIISEMISNLIKHQAVEGEMLVRPLPQNKGLEIICLDLGPGMADVQRMVEDGVSTMGTSGQGLGAIKRISDEFDIFSARGVGTVILSRIYKGQHKPKPYAQRQLEVGVVMVPKAGETACGDGLVVREAIDKFQILALDGLGHGEFAREASQTAADTFLANPQAGPADILRNLHQALKRTRGAVGNVTTIDLANQALFYCGVGNIAGKVFGGAELVKSVISYNGILGHNIPNTLHNHEVPWNPNCLLVLHSDGLKSKWDLTKFKDIHRHDASILAAWLYKNFNRGTDDTLVLVAKSRGKYHE